MTLRTPTVTVEHRPLVGNSRDIEITAEQRLGEVCVEPECTARDGLVRAGHVYHEAPPGMAPLGWAVVACPPHAPEAAR
jgi:hypothetical protein